jgi:hypothetical protein
LLFPATNASQGSRSSLKNKSRANWAALETFFLLGGGLVAGRNHSACDLCFIKHLQFVAGSPFYDGPLLASMSIYEAKTSSCSVSGYPLTTSTLHYTV